VNAGAANERIDAYHVESIPFHGIRGRKKGR